MSLFNWPIFRDKARAPTEWSVEEILYMPSAPHTHTHTHRGSSPVFHCQIFHVYPQISEANTKHHTEKETNCTWCSASTFYVKTNHCAQDIVNSLTLHAIVCEFWHKIFSTLSANAFLPCIQQRAKYTLSGALQKCQLFLIKTGFRAQNADTHDGSKNSRMFCTLF